MSMGAKQLQNPAVKNRASLCTNEGTWSRFDVHKKSSHRCKRLWIKRLKRFNFNLEVRSARRRRVQERSAHEIINETKKRSQPFGTFFGTKNLVEPLLIRALYVLHKHCSYLLVSSVKTVFACY
jgi:hypothetical protein